MVRVLKEEDAIRRPHLIEYDRQNPSPCFRAEQLLYIESLPDELSQPDRTKLDKIEYFILNRNHGHLLSVAVPGLRVRPGLEVRYVKRFNADAYWTMINAFLDYVPADFPRDQVGRCNLPTIRLTTPDGARFYPIEFNGNLPAWRKRLDDNAAVFCTLTGRFNQGKFVTSDGGRTDVADLDIAWVGQEAIPPDF